MIKYLFTVWDSKAKTHCNPFTSVNQQTALRDFAQAANDSGTQIAKFPTDFTLFEVGEFDDETCTFNIHPAPVNLGMASQFTKE